MWRLYIISTLLLNIILTSAEVQTILEIQSSDRNRWSSVVLNKDGREIFAAIDGKEILHGRDLGLSSIKLTGYDWGASNAWHRNWQALAMSDQRELICAAMSDGGIHTSTNGFSSWNVSQVPTAKWSAVAVSATGKHVFATQKQEDGSIFFSRNYGILWTKSNIGLIGPWCSIACSSIGIYVAVASCNGGIHISKDYGESFAESFAGPAALSSITMDGSGKEIIATVSWGKIHVSHDLGATWSTAKAPVANWKAVTSSKSGQLAYAVVFEGGLYYSDDYGDTWKMSKSPIRRWNAIATSSDGSVIAATDYDGCLYANHHDISTDIPWWLQIASLVLLVLIFIALLTWCFAKIHDYIQDGSISNPYKVDETLLPTRG